MMQIFKMEAKMEEPERFIYFTTIETKPMWFKAEYYNPNIPSCLQGEQVEPQAYDVVLADVSSDGWREYVPDGLVPARGGRPDQYWELCPMQDEHDNWLTLVDF